MSKDIFAGTENLEKTIFPSIEMLSNAWNLNLVRKVYASIAKEARTLTSTFNVFNIKNQVSQSCYFNGKLFESVAYSLIENGVKVNYEMPSVNFDNKEVRETIFILVI